MSTLPFRFSLYCLIGVFHCVMYSDVNLEFDAQWKTAEELLSCVDGAASPSVIHRSVNTLKASARDCLSSNDRNEIKSRLLNKRNEIIRKLVDQGDGEQCYNCRGHFQRSLVMLLKCQHVWCVGCVKKHRKYDTNRKCRLTCSCNTPKNISMRHASEGFPVIPADDAKIAHFDQYSHIQRNLPLH